MRTLQYCGVALCLLWRLATWAAAVPQQQSTPPFTLNVNSRIVFLDVTVLDKQSHPVTQGLSKDDFSVFEDHRPQSIASFEAPGEHVPGNLPAETSSTARLPYTEIVLDRLNSTFTDFSYNVVALRRYLAAQPPQMQAPIELMLLDNTALETIQAYTLDRDELLFALDHLAPAFPQKLNSQFYRERLIQSLSAMREIAFRNEGIPGRKNVLWLGTGIGVNLAGINVGYQKLKWFSHDTTNALVNGRISVFVIPPGPATTAINFLDMGKETLTGLNREDPFSADIGTAALAYQTGGTVLRAGNWPDRLIAQAQTYGTNFYTLTYRPPNGTPDGHFCRIFVKMRDPKLRAVTKIGYYAPDSKAPFNQRQQAMFHVTSAVQSAIPLSTIGMGLVSVTRHTDTAGVELQVKLDPKAMEWHPDDQGGSEADLMLAAASLDRRREILASRFQDLPISVGTQDPTRLADITPVVKLTLRLPRKTESIRVVLEAEGQRRSGSLDIPRATIDAAEDRPTPAPTLLARPPRP